VCHAAWGYNVSIGCDCRKRWRRKWRIKVWWEQLDFRVKLKAKLKASLMDLEIAMLFGRCTFAVSEFQFFKASGDLAYREKMF
jgi:hypothetical protein